jgi:hypothetical protein
MKRIALICSIAIAVFGLLTGCNSPFGGAREGEPNLIINLAGANARFSYRPEGDDFKQINAVLVVTKAGAVAEEHKFAGNEAFSIKVEPGEYTIMLSLFYKNGNSDVPLAKMTAPESVTVEANKITSKTVTVTRQFTVAGVTVSPSYIIVEPGKSRQFSAVVTINEDLPQDVTWAVEGAAGSGTSISADGLLTVGAGETAGSLIVKATSTLENISRDITVILGDPSPEMPADAFVTVTGDYWVGSTLTATTNLTGAYYQWRRDDGDEITGATGATYTLAAEDIGAVILVEVRSDAYLGVLAGALKRTVTLPPLPSDAAVTVSGATTVFQTLTANLTGFWSDGTGAIYQWKRNDEDITTGGTSNTYILQAADAGTVISVEVSHGDYSGSRTAKISGTVAPATLTGTVSISPDTGVYTGTLLTATYSGGSESGLTYQWKHGTTDVGTNSNTYTPTAAGSYTVTVSAAGYESKTSAAVTIAALTLQSIAVTTPPTKTTYTVGQTLDTTGMVVTATYSNGSSKTVTPTSTSGFSSTTVGSKTVTVHYTEGGIIRTTSFTVTVGTFTPDPPSDATVLYVAYTANGGGWPGSVTWATAVSTINAAGDGANYAIIVTESFPIAGTGTGGKTFTPNNLTIYLAGKTGNERLYLNSNGRLLLIDATQTVTLEGLTLQGKTANTFSVVGLYAPGAIFNMNSGKITGNTCSTGGGVLSAGTFNMHGGEISGNTSTNGGGVSVNAGGIFNMMGGEISGNTASASGGGVVVDGGSTFNMTGGKVSSNKAEATGYAGGGIYLTGEYSSESSKFTMSGGEVSGNTSAASATGGGVMVYFNSTFTMTGGKISGNTNSGVSVYSVANRPPSFFSMIGGEVSGNTSAGSGGGVNVGGNAAFTMTSGKVSDNTAATRGGGISVAGGGMSVIGDNLFTMNGGEVSGNTANGTNIYNDGGGGVSIGVGTTFTMNGGTISGNTAANSGGGVAVVGNSSGDSTFRIVTGMVYGSDAGALSNTATGTTGSAALFKGTAGFAESGTFDTTDPDNPIWNGADIPMNTGSLTARDATIHVVNGVLQ